MRPSNIMNERRYEMKNREKVVEPTPAYHNINNFKDVAAVSFASFILSHYSKYRMIPKLDSVDKWPNIDGYIELQEDNQLIGKVEVQVKTLPDNHNFKFHCPVSFLAYVEKVAINPVILLLVNFNEKRVYWIHMSEDYLESLRYKDNTSSYTLSINANDFFDEVQDDFIDKWTDIVVEYKNRIKNYNNISNLNEVLKNSQNEAIGAASIIFVQIHMFLDYLNYYLNTKFKPFKEIYFGKCWRIGIVINVFTENSLKYSLYPIPYDKNDVQIKFIDNNTYLEISRMGHSFIHCIDSNPIIENPQNFALEACVNLFKSVLDERKLKHPFNPILASEICFGIIDKFHTLFGLSSSEEYTSRDLRFAFFNYLPTWVDEAIKHLIKNNINDIKKKEDCLAKGNLGMVLPYYDPMMLSSYIIDKETISNNVNEKIMYNSIFKNELPINSKRCPLKCFEEIINYLEELHEKSIKRMFRKFDYKRAHFNGSLTYNLLSKDDLLYNAELIYSVLPNLYDNFIELNFSELKNEIRFYNNFDIAIMAFELKEKYQDYESPKATILYLVSDEKVNNAIEILPEYLWEEVRKYDMRKNIYEYKGTKYKVCVKENLIFDKLFKEFPLFNLLYETLKKRLEYYSKNS